ncbi:MAG TPA: Gfo/Idh/MocA family oxidoreductase [Verrucomicrobiales bacterium]|nr:Gfo/Idh/MocA family oxidoreductase [Verrucomicrobiales bacterium]
MQSEKNIAAIGAGAWGRNIVRTLNDMGRLGAVAETSSVLREQAGKDYPNIETVSDYAKLFSRSDITAVTIATPAVTHHTIAKDCLLAGKDVFVEKPITLSVAAAEELVSIAEREGRILMVNHLLLYKPAVQFLKDYLAGGGLGKVFTYHQERMKLGKARAVENALVSLGVHDVAALLYLVGASPINVMCSGHCGLRDHVEDDTYLHMTFADGRMAHLHNTWLWPEDRRGLKIIGERGMIVYDEKEETVTFFKKRIDSQLNNVDEGSEVLYQVPKDFQPLNAVMEHFMECIETRKTPRSCGRNGLEVVRVLRRAGAF